MTTPILTRYSKPSKDLLVDMINQANKRKLIPSQLNFLNPTLLGEDGLSTVDIQFDVGMGWSAEVRPLTYYRVEPGKLSYLDPIVVFVNDFEVQSVCDAILDQYGVLLEPELIEMTVHEPDLEDSLINDDLNGFTPMTNPEGETILVPNAFQNNRDITIAFKPEHLIFFGELKVRVRPALEFLDTTIDSLLDIREYYKDDATTPPPVELYLKHGEATLTDDIPQTVRRSYEVYLRTLTADELIEEDDQLDDLLEIITGDEWKIDAELPGSFNLYGAKVVYNGLTTEQQQVNDAAYNYVLVLELSGACSNLSGLLRIAYRYADPRSPENRLYNKASPLPVFSK